MFGRVRLPTAKRPNGDPVIFMHVRHPVIAERRKFVWVNARLKHIFPAGSIVISADSSRSLVADKLDALSGPPLQMTRVEHLR